MTEEAAKFEEEQAEALMGGGNSNAGMIVKTKSGLVGKVLYEPWINGKVRVYCGKLKLLCNPKTLTNIGFID